MTQFPLPSSRRLSLLGLFLSTLTLSACTIFNYQGFTRVQLSNKRVPTPFPDDDVREWVVTDSAGREHHLRLVQQATASDARMLVLQDSGRTLFTMTEHWVKGGLGDWFLDTRDVLTWSPEGGALRWPVTPGRALDRAASHPDSARLARYQLTHAPRLELGAGCGPYSLTFLAFSLMLDAALAELSITPGDAAYQRATSQASFVGAGYEKYSTCVTNSAAH